MLKDNIMLSIIIPHYNSYEMLKRLLNSIENHSFIQIIVVDDCSSDDIEPMLRMDFPHINFFRTENNKGAGHCRNIGLKYAIGKWILFADADDYFAEGFYDKLKKYFDSEYDIIYFSPKSIYDDTGMQADRHKKYEQMITDYCDSQTKLLENCLRYKYTPPWSKMIRNSMLQENKITFEETKVSNDVVFSVKSGYYAKMVAVDKQVIYWVTRSKGTLTTKRDFVTTYIRLEEYIKTYLFLKERISKKELKELNWCGGRYWLLAVQNRYTIREWYKLSALMIKNQLPIWDRHFVSKSIRAIKKEKKMKKYISEK